MALTLRQNGSTSANLVTASWWNDYYNLLTGVMTDQPVTIANTVAVTGAGTTSNKYVWSTTLGGVAHLVFYIAPPDAGAQAYGLYYNTDNTLHLKNYTTGQELLSVAPGGTLSFLTQLSATNKELDLQQGYGLYSDNTASTFSGGTTRLWLDAPNNGEVHLGGRTSTNVLAGIRFRTHQLMFDDDTIQAGLLITPSLGSVCRVFVQTSTPTGTVNAGDIWVDG